MSVIKSYYAGAAVDGSAWTYKIIKREANAANKARVALSGAADIDGFGVATDIGLGSVGQSVAVCVAGECKVMLGGAFTPGTTRASFKADANGLAVPATDDDFAIGYLLMDEAVTYASGDVVNAVVSLQNKGA